MLGEAFLLKLGNEDLKGDGQAKRLALAAIYDSRAKRNDEVAQSIASITSVVVAPGAAFIRSGYAAVQFIEKNFRCMSKHLQQSNVQSTDKLCIRCQCANGF